MRASATKPLRWLCWSGPWPRTRSRKTHYLLPFRSRSLPGWLRARGTRIALSPLCRNSCRYRILGRSLQACRSRPRFFGSIQCSMDFEMIRGSKNSWARTRTSEPATPDSEPDYLGEREDALLIQIVWTKSYCRAHIAGKDIPSASRGGKHPGWQIPDVVRICRYRQELCEPKLSRNTTVIVFRN